MDETIVFVGAGSGAATERLLGLAANQYRVVQVGPQQFQFARTYRPLWALVLGIVLLPVLIGIVFFFVKSTETWVATIEEDHRQVMVRIRGTVAAPILVALRESLGAPAPVAAPAAPGGMVVDAVGVPGGMPASPAAPPPFVVPVAGPAGAGDPGSAPFPPAAASPVAAPAPAPMSAPMPAPGPPPVSPLVPTVAPAPMPAPSAVVPPPQGAPVLPSPAVAPVPPPGPPPVQPPVSPPVPAPATELVVDGFVPPIDVPPAQRTPVRPLRIDQVPVATPPAADGAVLDEATSARLPVRTFLLQLDDGAEFVVTGRTLVGRDPEPAPGEAIAERLPVADQDRSISKTHLVVELGAGGELRVLDRGSTNGTSVTRVDGRVEQVAAQSSTAVQPGDVVQFGQRSFRVEQRGG